MLWNSQHATSSCELFSCWEFICGFAHVCISQIFKDTSNLFLLAAQLLPQSLSHFPIHVGVSKNNGTPKSSIFIGFSIINHPFWGTPCTSWRFRHRHPGPSHIAWMQPWLSWVESRLVTPVFKRVGSQLLQKIYIEDWYIYIYIL